jgi:hypothetical protein
MISPVGGSWIAMARSPHPYLPAHPKKVSTGMKGINGDEKMDKSRNALTKQIWHG